jgi:polyhydroxybutyrate depolymerase
MLRLFILAVSCLWGLAASACGSAIPCQIEGGEYRFLLPIAVPSLPKPGLLIFVHGHRSSAAEMLAYAELVQAAKALNLILVAPQGINDTWSTPGAPSSGLIGQNRNEVPFIRRMLDDLPARVEFDTNRVVLSGFSQGASVVWHVACQGDERIRLFMPIAGVWWQPMPQTCAGPPVNLLHIHGMSDPVMPMTGRRLRETWQQGDVKEAIRRMGLHNQCTGASVSRSIGPLTCTKANDCARGSSVDLCLHEGDHHTDPSWFVLLRNQMEQAMR